MLEKFACHYYRYRQQYNAIAHTKSSLGSQDLLVHIDFSENYSTKCASEPQSKHFGQRGQIVIHQGIAYSKVRMLKRELHFYNNTKLMSDCHLSFRTMDHFHLLLSPTI
jgi:hypothetical protein